MAGAFYDFVITLLETTKKRIHSRLTDRIAPIHARNPGFNRYSVAHGRHTRQIRPTRNQNAFRHGSAGIELRRADGVLNPAEQSIRKEILSDLLPDKG
jgi:hypothetical protein